MRAAQDSNRLCSQIWHMHVSSRIAWTRYAVPENITNRVLSSLPGTLVCTQSLSVNGMEELSTKHN